MSDEKVDYLEKYYNACTRMFSKAIARILESALHYEKKLEYLHRIDNYIDKAAEKRL